MFNHDDRHRLARLEERLDQILRVVNILAGVEIHNMHTTEEIIALANQASSDTESLKTLVGGLRGQVASLLSSSSVSPTTQAAIDQVFDRMQANHVAAMAAINNEGPGLGASTEETAVGSSAGNIDTSGVTMVDGASGASLSPNRAGDSPSIAAGEGLGASGATGSDAGASGASGATG